MIQKRLTTQKFIKMRVVGREMKLDITRDLIVFDVETSGNSVEDSIIQLGACRFSKNCEISKDVFNVYIRPYTENWSERSEKIHGLSKDFLKERGIFIKEAIEQFENWSFKRGNSNAKKIYLSQWSCGFDTGCLKNAYSFLNRTYPFSGRSYDIASFVRLVLALKKYGKNIKEGAGLINCARRLDIEINTKAHDALNDALLTAKVLKKTLEKLEQ